MNHREWGHHTDAAVSLGYRGTAWDTASPVSAAIYVNHSMQCLEELDNLNSDLPIRAYVWGQDVAARLDMADSPFISMAGAGGVGGLLCMVTAESGKVGTYQMTCDGNGNIVKLLNASGSQMVLYRYGPFGEDLLNVPHYVYNPYRFSTKFNETALDGNTTAPPELYDYGFRWYHADLGRWTARDPIGEEGGINVYSVGNNPLTSIDVFGLALIKSDWDVYFDHKALWSRSDKRFLGRKWHAPWDTDPEDFLFPDMYYDYYVRAKAVENWDLRHLVSLTCVDTEGLKGSDYGIDFARGGGGSQMRGATEKEYWVEDAFGRTTPYSYGVHGYNQNSTRFTTVTSFETNIQEGAQCSLKLANNKTVSANGITVTIKAKVESSLSVHESILGTEGRFQVSLTPSLKFGNVGLGINKGELEVEPIGSFKWIPPKPPTQFSAKAFREKAEYRYTFQICCRCAPGGAMYPEAKEIWNRGNNANYYRATGGFNPLWLDYPRISREFVDVRYE